MRKYGQLAVVWTVTLALVAICWFATSASGAQSRTGEPIPSAVRLQPWSALGSAGAVRDSADVPAPQAGLILRVLQRRKVGATFRNVRKIIDEMKADGSIAEYVYDEGGQQVVDVSSLAVEVASRLHTENPGSWWDEIDWDALFAFLEKIIMLIISLFGIVCLNLRAVRDRLLAVLHWCVLRKD